MKSHKMDFFNRHMNSSVANTTIEETSFQPVMKDISNHINREFRTPLPLKGSLKNIHPIAESTPVFAVPKPVKELKIPPAKSASVTKVKVSKKLSVPEVKPATTVKHAESQLQGDIVEIKKPIESVSHQPLTASKGITSTEDQMEVLYESLQAEAKKIQQFKVQALAQIKQKTEDILMKQTRISSLSSVLTSVKMKNNEMSNNLRRQKSNNEEIVKKVATTREMCFSLAEDHLGIKRLLAKGDSVKAMLTKKIESHSLRVNGALEEIGQGKSDIQEKLIAMEQTVESRETEYKTVIQELIEKEQSMKDVIQDKDTDSVRLRKQLEEKAKELTLMVKNLDEAQQSSAIKEAELMAAMEKLKLCKDEEMNSLQTKIGQSEAYHALTKQTLVSDMDDLRDKLDNCQSRLDEKNISLMGEVSRCEELCNEKAECEKQIEELKSRVDKFRIQQLTLENEMKDKDEAYKVKCESEEKLKQEIESLNITKSELTASCELLQSTQISTSELLQKTNDDLEQKQATVTLQLEELAKLRELMDQYAVDESSFRSAMKESMDNMRQEHQKEKDSLTENISDVEAQLQQANVKIEELTSQQKETIDNHDGEINTLNNTVKAQQAEYESQIKLNSETFTKVQDELQRMLTEKETKLDQEVQKVEELNRDMEITKKSLDQSLKENNEVVSQLTNKTQELQEVSNKLLVKDCEFSKLMCAVQNLKSRCAAVAVPMTPVATPQHATIRPTAHATPARTPSTPKSLTPYKSHSAPGMTTPQMSGIAAYKNSTPRSSQMRKPPPMFSTPRTPISSQASDNPKGILRSEGSASKPNRVVFSTPIEQKGAVPSDSDTSVLDIETVNKSFKSSTPQSVASGRGMITPITNLSQQKSLCVTPSSRTTQPLTPTNRSLMNHSISPALSSQSAGDRLPRSKMIRPPKKRLRPASDTRKREELGLVSKTMKKHKAAVMGHTRPMNAARPIRESDSDCFGFGSE